MIAALQKPGTESARLEAQLLLAHVLGVPRSAILAGLYPEPDSTQQARLAALVAERQQGVPAAYLLDAQEFYCLTFRLDRRVLIPRPETEMLVDFACEALDALPAADRLVFADVGTGSGCIAIAVLTCLPQARALATDLAPATLATARTNALTHGVAERLRLGCMDLLSGVGSGQLELVLANPPYIPSAEIAELQPEVRDWEPRIALDGGPDGLAVHRRLMEAARRTLKPGGLLAVETAFGQAASVAALADAAGFTEITIRQDLAGIERMVSGRKLR